MADSPLGTITGSQTLQQFFIWGILQQLIGALLAPEFQALTNTVNSVNQEVPLSPADAALAVIRNILPAEEAAKLAAMSGLSPDNFATLTLLTGDAPAPEALAEALRRGFIDAARYLTGIRQGRLRDEWATTMQELATHDPTPVDALTALLHAQTDAATAQDLYRRWGGNPEYFQLMFDTQGASPSPVQAGHMALRGIIPWSGTGAGVVSFEQAIREGRERNKWIPAYQQLAQYLPPPRTVTALVREGALTHDQALKLWEQAGLSPELAQAYLESASAARTTGAKELAISVVHSLYTDRLIDTAEAEGFLGKVGYDATEATYILSVWDMEWKQRALRAAATRIGTLYVGHKITDAVARAELANIGVPAKNVTELVTIWAFEREANVRQLTEAQIVDAWEYGILDIGQAESELQAIGYTAADAATLIAIKNKGPLTPPTGG